MDTTDVKKSRSEISRKSHSIGKYDLVIENEFIKCRVYWTRVVGSETESLFTQYTKHTFYEIQYALDGNIVMRIDKNRHVRVEQSNFIVIPPDTFHQIADGDSVGARFIMAFSLEVKNPSLKHLPSDLSTLEPHRETMQMRSLLEIIISKKIHRAELERRLISTYLECLMLEFIEAVSRSAARDEVESEAMNLNEARVLKVQKFIADYNGIGIRPSDIAQKFNVSERHLNRIFVEVTGKTVREAINRQKLSKIEELITTTTLSFREISELCEFSNESAMNKFFKRYNNCGLGDFRNLRQ